jgi:hypothetical protein
MVTARRTRHHALWATAILAAPLLCLFLSTAHQRAKYGHGLRRGEELLAQHEEWEGKLRDLQSYYARFIGEDEFRQRVVRERLGYAEGDETIYIFED